MDIILKGILYGMVLALLIGPVFFTILQTSIEHGFATGLLVAVGVSMSDTFYIALAYLGLARLLDNPGYKIYLAYTGGLILLAFGIYYLLVKSQRLLSYDQQRTKSKSYLRYIAKGFIINGLSPLVLVFWVGTVGFATTELGYDTLPKAAIFFGSIVATVFSTDILKAKLADKLRMMLTPHFIRLMNIILGMVFVFFGGRLIILADQMIR
jgi:threonine/homoserine/homoserine lactone efflux protein